MADLREQLQALKNEENADSIDKIIKSADDLHKSNKTLYSRAKKAEGFEQNNEGKWIKKEKPEPDIKPKAKKPDEPDKSEKLLQTAHKALLTSLGYKDQEQQDYVLNAVEKYKVEDIFEIINDDFHKSKLKAIADKLAVQGNMPKGGGKGGGGASDSVEYWLAKGEIPPDQELAEKVVAAKMKAETNKKQFSDTPYVG